jgi:putative transposase
MLLALFAQLISCQLAWLERHYMSLTQLRHSSLLLALASDIARSKPDLVLENALLRQQLLILQRQVKKPRFTHTECLSLLLLASRLQNWKHLLLILKPDTLLRWHRQGFRLFWRFKTRTRLGRPRLTPDLITLIQQMGRENQTWGAECIRGELLKLGIRIAKDCVGY